MGHKLAAFPLTKALREARRPWLWPLISSNHYVLLSYPKSGRTWVRFMIDSYLVKQFQRKVPQVFLIETDAQVIRRHHVIYSHFTGAMLFGRPYYDMARFDERMTLVPRSHGILLTRNLYATLASAYFHARYRINRFTGTPSDFLRDPRYGAIKIITFYNLWLELKNEFRSTRVFSYESLRKDTKGTLVPILDSCGITPVDEQIVDRVVAESSLERMQQVALSDAYRGTVLAPIDAESQDTWKVRRGTEKGHRSLFSEADLLYVAQLVDDLLIDKTLVDYAH